MGHLCPKQHHDILSTWFSFCCPSVTLTCYITSCDYLCCTILCIIFSPCCSILYFVIVCTQLCVHVCMCELVLDCKLQSNWFEKLQIINNQQHQKFVSLFFSLLPGEHLGEILVLDTNQPFLQKNSCFAVYFVVFLFYQNDVCNNYFFLKLQVG